jgi:hypothetical protein
MQGTFAIIHYFNGADVRPRIPAAGYAICGRNIFSYVTGSLIFAKSSVSQMRGLAGVLRKSFLRKPLSPTSACRTLALFGAFSGR